MEDGYWSGSSFPANLWWVWETLSYQGNDYAVEAELLAMAVAPDLRRRGLGLDFGTRFRALSRRGADEAQGRVGGIGVVGVCVASLIALSWSMLMILLGVDLGIPDHPN